MLLRRGSSRHGSPEGPPNHPLKVYVDGDNCKWQTRTIRLQMKIEGDSRVGR